MNELTIDTLRKNNLIVWEAICGSRAYGTNTETSDTDIRGIYVQPLEDILSFGYCEQVSDDNNDIIFYEIKRFLELLQVNNPNLMEILNVPNDCIIHSDPIMDIILEKKDDFISKRCKESFANYAVTQIKKARGLNKKMNWEENEMKRKTVLDFCYVLLKKGGSKPFKEWLIDYNDVNKCYGIKYNQKIFGLAAIDHARDTYAMYDLFYHSGNSAGIVSDEDRANDVQLTSIPKGLVLISFLVFNKDGYSSHCKKYKEYQQWLENRNEDRVKMNKNHGKHYDGKNLSHCIRLLTMANEIFDGNGVIVRRNPEEVKKLLAIKRGDYEYEDILKEADDLIEQMNEKFNRSDLPNNIDENFVNDLLLKIRKIRYNLK